MNNHAEKRTQILMNCFDKLPEDLRLWIYYLPFSLHDDIIMRGERAVRLAKKDYEDSGGKWYEVWNGVVKN